MAQKKEQPKDQDATLAKVLKDFQSSWDYCAGSWHDRWNDNYYLYNNNRVKRGYEGITDTFVPMIFSTIESMTSALFGSKPRFNFIPPQERPDQNTDILNSLLDYYWDKDQWSIKFINWGRDFLRYGTSIIYLHWQNGCPRVINVPIRDFFIDPTCSSLENAGYMGRRFLTTIDELKSFEVIDLEAEPDAEGNYPMKKKYKRLDEISSSESGDGENTDKQEKDMWYGSTVTDPEQKQVECIEYWTEDRVITIANRSTVIEDTENWYKTKARENGEDYPKGLVPFASLRNYVDGSLFYAKGEIDFLADQQELLNDLTNQNIDAVTFTLNPMYTLDPRYSHMINEIENIPGAVYPVEAGSLQPIPMGNIPQDAFNERLNIKSEMRETSASNEIVKGVSQSGGKITATEIQAQIAGAGQRISLKVTQIEDEGFHKLAEIVFQMIRLYVSEPMLVRIVGKDGIRWEEFDPTAFMEGDYEPRVQLETTVEGKKQEDAAMAKEMLGAFLNDPEVNQQELKKLVLTRAFDLDPDEVQILMAPPEGLGQEGMPGMELPSEEMPIDPIMADPMAGLPPEMMDALVDPLTGELISAAEMPLEREVML
jgi:hypothetical protein